ncbi:hypothetical protein INT45_013037 [Circinella minor]|uniref:Uncharacterized protein n=1 Tax=Circinella minor TaxID=1195481 RepID=A0A8H7S2D2_9FUNG|nr:hypothetical protein INT45_013037 [Circinella minor]
MTSNKILSLIVEQTNPLEAGTQAKYTIRHVDSTDGNKFILSFPRGAYTGMRTVQKTAIVELSSHMKRLTNSLSLIKFAPENDDVEPEHVSNELSSFRDPTKLEEKLIPLLKTGLSSFNHDEQETKVMIIVGYSHKEQKPCFAAQFTPLSAPIQERVKVEVENKARDTPVVKDSQWVRERAGLEKSKAKDVNEVLLTDDAGNLYEGMSSNFFAVKTGEDGTSRLLLPIKGLYFNDGSAPILFPEASESIEFLRNQVKQEIYQRAYKILE